MSTRARLCKVSTGAWPTRRKQLSAWAACAQVDVDGNIVDSCFKTFGCGSAIASSSVATEWVKGRSIDDVRPCCLN